MPLYEYRCEVCNHHFELIQKFSDPPVHVCPVCGGSVHKLLSSPAIQFKGSGWYVTDYAKKEKTTPEKEKKEKKDEGKSADTGKTAASEATSPSAGSSTSSSSTDKS